jgi:hypothetical protein
MCKDERWKVREKPEWLDKKQKGCYNNNNVRRWDSI